MTPQTIAACRFQYTINKVHARDLVLVRHCCHESSTLPLRHSNDETSMTHTILHALFSSHNLTHHSSATALRLSDATVAGMPVPACYEMVMWSAHPQWAVTAAIDRLTSTVTRNMQSVDTILRQLPGNDHHDKVNDNAEGSSK